MSLKCLDCPSNAVYGPQHKHNHNHNMLFISKDVKILSCITFHEAFNESVCVAASTFPSMLQCIIYSRTYVFPFDATACWLQSVARTSVLLSA